MTQDDYDSKFETKNPKSEKLKAAFSQVSDIRKFEIDLYWKRAGYFWALIAVAFAGYFAILSSEKLANKLMLSFIVAAIGLVFTFAWYLVNRGSKYWQENWENHLDLLEDEITGPLYKTLLERPGWYSWTDKWVTGPYGVSVSKINQWVSVFVFFIWLLLMVYSFLKAATAFRAEVKYWLKIGTYVVVFGASMLSCVFMWTKGKTHKGKHNPKVVQRTTKIQTAMLTMNQVKVAALIERVLAKVPREELGDAVIFGSAAFTLIEKDLNREIDDLDLFVSEGAYARLKQRAKEKEKKPGVFTLDVGVRKVEIFKSFPGVVHADVLAHAQPTADSLGIRVAALDELVTWKRAQGRKKDKADLAAIGIDGTSQ